MGCCFSSNSPSISEHSRVGTKGSGGSSTVGPGPRARGRALVGLHSPGTAKALIFLIESCSNFPSSPAVAALAARRGSGGQAGCICLKETSSCRRPGLWPQLWAGDRQLFTFYLSIQHLVGLRAALDEEEGGGCFTQSLPEPRILP